MWLESGAGVWRGPLQEQGSTSFVSAELDTRLVDEVDVAVIAVDPAGVVLRWNRHAEEIYGWSAAEAVGAPPAGAGAIAPEDAAFAQQVMRKVAAAGPGSATSRSGAGTGRSARCTAGSSPSTRARSSRRWWASPPTSRRPAPIEAERRRNEQELEYLARASAILDSSLDLPVTLQQLAELAVPFIGDGCMVDVRREDGTIERYAIAAVDEGLASGIRAAAPASDRPRRRATPSRARCDPASRSCRSRSTARTARPGAPRKSTGQTCGASPAGW